VGKPETIASLRRTTQSFFLLFFGPADHELICKVKFSKTKYFF
jgi:hypothetical protein